MSMQSQREPFFKPLNNDINHNFDFAGKQQTRNRQGQQLNESTKQDEEFAVNGERLTSLHAKLHQEADKIRKWKNQTEFDIKQKDQKLQESTQTVDALRKSILDLQLQNESLSMTLQEEMSNREDILNSVAATRNLCSILKESLTNTEGKVAACVGEKTEIRYQEEEHRKTLEVLSDKFKTLELARTEEYNELTKQLTVVAGEKERLRTEMKQKSIEAESKLKDLLEKCDEKDIEIRDIRAQVEKNKDKIHTLKQDIDTLKENLRISEEELNKAQEQNKELCRQNDTVQISKSEVEDELKSKVCEVADLTGKNSDLHLEMVACKEKHEADILQLQSELQENKAQVNQKHITLQFLETDLEKTNSLLEDMKSSKDMLIMEKAELENSLRELEKLNSELLAQHEQNCGTMSQMSNTIGELQNHLASSQQEGASLMLQLNDIRSQLSVVETEKLHMDERIRVYESDVDAKKTGIVDLQRELAAKCQCIDDLTHQLTNLEELLNTERTCHEGTQLVLSETVKNVGLSKKEIAAKIKEIQKIQKELDNLTKKTTQQTSALEKGSLLETELREEIEKLQSELEIKKEANENLLEERQQNDEALQGKLSNKEKAASDLETKNKAMKTDITAKNKQIKELEKELKSLKSKLTSHTKTLENQEEEVKGLKSCVEGEVAEKESLQQKLLELEQHATNLQTETDTAKDQAKKMKELADKSVKEKDKMFKQCEGQRAEMSNIMAKYKTENDQLVTKKEKEIEDLKTMLTDSKSKSKKETDGKMSKLQAEVEQLRNTISESGYQMENLQKNVGEKESLMVELEKQNTQKNEELRELQSQLEKMFIKQTTTAVAQTSPFPDKTYHASYSKIPTPKAAPRTPKITPRENVCTTPATLTAPKTPLLLRTPATSTAPKTPLLLRTPVSSMKTPSRGILKSLPTNSASKRRKVVFARKDMDEESNSGESESFEVMDMEDDNGPVSCATPLLLKKSPKARPEPKLTDTPNSRENMNKAIPLNRTPRAPPVDLDKKRQKKTNVFPGQENQRTFDEENNDEEQLLPLKAKKDKLSSVRKAPNKSPGKFFKSSPKNRMAKFKEKQDISWLDNDDIFGFGSED